MFGNAGAVASGSVLDTDVCVVGGGPAGITLAMHLRGSGLRVLVLESGGLSTEVKVQQRARGESVGYPYYPLADMQIRAFGGNSNVWNSTGVRMRPLDAVDMEATAAGAEREWPFSRDQLTPFYRKACDFLGLAESFDAQYWTARSGTLPLPLGGEQGAGAYSTVFQFAERDAYRRYEPPLRSDADVTVLLHATVLQVASDDTAERVSHLEVGVDDGAGGARFRVRAKTYVLAAGGIESARLLLLGNRNHPNGLGNEHDLVGRFFQDHIGLRSGLLIPNDPTLISRVDFYRGQRLAPPRWMGMLAPTQEVVRREGLLNSTWYILPLPESMVTPAAQSLAVLERAATHAPRPPHLAEHVRRAASRPRETIAVLRERHYRRGTKMPQVLQLKVMAEQAPNPRSRVTLGRRRDASGRPCARLDWRVEQRDIDSIRRTQDILDRALLAAGIGRVSQRIGDDGIPELLHGNEHQIGTTRMHRDPRFGVVDPQGRVHGIANLYVCGPSVFPSCGYANPTLTVTALAIRLAEHLSTHAGLGVRVESAADSLELQVGPEPVRGPLQAVGEGDLGLPAQ